ncbi:PREDICTED: gastrula zinc finger protein XlCGF7.1-like [Nicrophorus vespilloides]|uniref:Gastrula zinc finger protein XlCGF7.1-like n=1 Tax=Nicrophorus vespilloides TaxID=110193 RepID=A0ABM1M277_NICVS|nr:PREDICTED: gastrula zinc finger protein XlCGF7.1-like [Nicrophorus vespilloides]
MLNAYKMENNNQGLLPPMIKNEHEESMHNFYNDYLQINLKVDYPSPPPPVLAVPKKEVVQQIKFHCEYCSKGFSTKGNLIVHTRTHTLEKPYVCNVCGKSFTAKGNLNTHMISHSNLKPFTCELCSKGFTTKGNLMVHMRSHNNEKPFGCDVCPKRFTTKGNLITHSMIHKDIKPFKCEFCDKQFATNNNLIIHKRTHTKEKPFVCNICFKLFHSKGNLMSHVKHRHPQDGSGNLISTNQNHVGGQMHAPPMVMGMGLEPMKNSHLMMH